MVRRDYSKVQAQSDAYSYFRIWITSSTNTGPFTPRVGAALEVIDTQIGVLMCAELAADPKAKIVIVSDHGFVAVPHAVNLNVLFAQAGLIRLTSVVTNSKSSVQITSLGCSDID